MREKDKGEKNVSEVFVLVSEESLYFSATEYIK